MAARRVLVTGGSGFIAGFGAAATKVPTRTIPNAVVRLAARLRAELRPIAADLDFVKQVSNDRARRVLGLQPRPAEQAIIAAAESMIARSLV